MTLTDFVEQYINSRDISDHYSNQLRWLVNALEQSAQREVLVTDLTVDFANWYLKSSRKTRSHETRKSHSRMILTLWQAAADENLIPGSPRKVRQLEVPGTMPHAWSADAVKLLLISASRMRGRYCNGQEKRLYWRSYVLAAWDSGLRGCDLRRVPAEAIQADGWANVIEHGTGKPMWLSFREETMAAIHESFPPERELIWPQWGRLEMWQRDARKLVTGAGLMGSIGQLRRSSGTDVELRPPPGRRHEHLANRRQVVAC